MKQKIIVPILIIAIVASFASGIYVGKGSKPSVEKISLLQNPEARKTTGADFSLFWDVWKTLEEKYVDRSKLDAQKMIYGAISGMLTALDNPYTLFLPPQENKKFQEDMQGEFGGIGAEIGIRKGVLTIVAPLEGSPAKRAGLMAQDKILNVDGKSTENLNVDEAVSLIRGEKGTEVKLTIFREGWSNTKEFKIIREIINVPALKYEFREPDVAYIQFYHFTENAGIEFQKIAERILADKKIKKIILDLRNNPGGYLETSVDVAGWFLPKGDLVAIEDFGNGEKIEYRSNGAAKLADYQLILLVNQGSASASEILAGALRDNKGIKMIGEKTFGKGSVQQLEELKGGSSLKITIAKWLTPSGKNIMNDGLESDIKIELTEDDINNNRDPQLDKALEMMR